MSYGNNDVGFTFLIIFVLLALVFVVGFLSCDLTSNSWRNKAVEVGAAEYYLDENNSRQWRWIPPYVTVPLSQYVTVPEIEEK